VGVSGEPARSRVLMAGEVVTRMTIMEVINVIANANWRGELNVVSPEHRRVLVFDQGALKTAHSDAPDDRLGEVLFRLGVLDRHQVDELVGEITRERRLGELLVERGLVDESKLFSHLQSQAQQIFYNALLVSEGHYVFRLPEESEAPPSATMHIPVQHLLMEGVQRVDEMALFRERIPNAQMCPQLKEGAGDRQLDPTSQTILAYCDGERTIEDISRQTGLGEFETTKAIYHLVQQGQVQLRAGAKIDEAAVRRLLRHFNGVMRDIFMAVATYGGIDHTRAKLARWISSGGHSALLGDRVEEDGSLDPERVLACLKRADHEHPVEGLHQALHELAAFALFATTNSLPRDQEIALARDVNRRLKAIRL
jgi:hypothetical protein